uniref:metallophosphoesterase n=1 Tax=Thiomicrorhabdus sp. TaxID=2039724 RepID=UPI0035699AD0
MRIVHLSDTHGCHEGEVELWLKTIKADVIVHSGDFSNRGTWGEAKLFFQWFKNLDFKHKILVPGNHDRFMVRLEKDPHERNRVVPEEITLLIDEAVEIDGVKFYGSPYTPAFNNWAFQLYPHNVEEHWNKIPEG